MADFTQGKWMYEEFVPEGVTLNGKEYMIFTESVNPEERREEIALVVKEGDAKLMTAAPAMYDLLLECLDVFEDIISRQCPDCSDDVENMRDYLEEFLARINGKEDEA